MVLTGDTIGYITPDDTQCTIYLRHNKIVTRKLIIITKFTERKKSKKFVMT